MNRESAPFGGESEVKTSGLSSGPEPTLTVKLEKLIQKCVQDKIMDVLTTQSHRLGKEIQYYESLIPAFPAEEKQKQVDLSQWLMPMPDLGGSK